MKNQLKIGSLVRLVSDIPDRLASHKSKTYEVMDIEDNKCKVVEKVFSSFPNKDEYSITFQLEYLEPIESVENKQQPAPTESSQNTLIQENKQKVQQKIQSAETNKPEPAPTKSSQNLLVQERKEDGQQKLKSAEINKPEPAPTKSSQEQLHPQSESEIQKNQEKVEQSDLPLSLTNEAQKCQDTEQEKNITTANEASKISSSLELSANTNDGQQKDINKEIPLDDIIVGIYQPRKYFDSEKEKELIESIKKHGVLEPVLVRFLDGKYELIAGERRYRSAKKAGLRTIPARVYNCDSKQALEMSILENLQREDLNLYEQTESILRLLSLKLDVPIDQVCKLLYCMQKERKAKTTHNVIGKQRKGKSNVIEPKTFELVEACLKGLMAFDSFVNNRLPILNLPEDILDVLKKGEIDYTKAKAIAKVKDKVIRGELLKEAIEQSLSLTEIKEKIKSTLSPKETDEFQPSQETDELQSPQGANELQSPQGTNALQPSQETDELQSPQEANELQQRFYIWAQRFKKLAAVSIDSEKHQKLKTIIEQLEELVA